MRVLSVINQKGGVGKSTSAHALAFGLFKNGKRVLLIDLDGQGNLTDTLGGTGAQGKAMEILRRPEAIKEAVLEMAKSKKGRLCAIWSSPSLVQADSEITQTGKEYRLKEALSLVAEDFDYCVIDTPPVLGVITVNALVASEGVIIPVQADMYSLQGVKQLYLTVQTVQKYCNPYLRVLGILITRFNVRAIIRREVAEVASQMAEAMGSKLFSTKIRECTALIEAQAKRVDIFSYAPRSNGAKDYKSFVQEVERS